MKINNIKNTNMHFGKVVKVDSVSNSAYGYSNKVDKSTYEVSKVLNGKNSSVYSKSEAKKIRSFFKNVLEDYNGKNGVFMIRSLGDVYLCSGDDAKEMRSYYKAAKKDIKDIKNSKLDVSSPNDAKNLIFDVKKKYNQRLKDRHNNGNGSYVFFNSSKITYSQLNNNQIIGKEKIDAKIDFFTFSEKKSDDSQEFPFKRDKIKL